MDFIENQVLVQINNLHKVQRAYAGMIDPKFVNIRGNKRCACCNNIITSGDRALTSSMPVDKKHGVNFTYAYNTNTVKKNKFVLVRQWMHKECAISAVNGASNVELKDRWYKRKNIEDIDFDKLSLYEKIEVLKYFYEKREISYNDFMDTFEEELDAGTELDLLNYFYHKGEITSEEYDRVSNGLIDYLAFEDALGLGQE